MDLSSSRAIVIPKSAQGLHVLLVDHDTNCLMLMASVLEQQSYKVTTTELASVALSFIGEREWTYDLVIAEVNMPEMNGFTLLKLILLIKEDIPIILMSSDHSDVRMAERALNEGACFFLWKPIRSQDLTNAWQHVYCKRSPEFVQKDDDHGHEVHAIIRESTREMAGIEKGHEGKRSRDENDGKRINQQNAKENKDDDDDDDDSSNSPKRQRLIWTPQLHRKFLDAFAKLGEDKAHPKELLNEMVDVPNVTHRHISSHLQKYKQYLKKIREKIIKYPPVFESMMIPEPTLPLPSVMIKEATLLSESLMTTEPRQNCVQNHSRYGYGHPQGCNLNGVSPHYNIDRLKQLFPSASNDQNIQTTLKNHESMNCILDSIDQDGQEIVYDDVETGHFGLKNVDPLTESWRNMLAKVLNADVDLHKEVDSMANNNHVSDQNSQDPLNVQDTEFKMGEEKYSLEELNEIWEDLNSENQEKCESTSVCPKEPLADNNDIMKLLERQKFAEWSKILLGSDDGPLS